MQESMNNLVDKITILSSPGPDSATFSIQEEDHTLGNALRFWIMRK